jgi:hypothetical protein
MGCLLASLPSLRTARTGSIKGDGEQRSARFATKTPVPHDFVPAGRGCAIVPPMPRTTSWMAGIGPLRRIAAKLRPVGSRPRGLSGDLRSMSPCGSSALRRQRLLRISKPSPATRAAACRLGKFKIGLSGVEEPRSGSTRITRPKLILTRPKPAMEGTRQKHYGVLIFNLERRAQTEVIEIAGRTRDSGSIPRIRSLTL